MKSQTACSTEHLRIVSERQMDDKERKAVLAQSNNRSFQMSGLIGELQRRYRRAESVRFFDEIMEEWN